MPSAYAAMSQAQVAAKAGLSRPAVSNKLKRGMSYAQILAEAKERAELKKGGHRNPHDKGAALVGLKRGKRKMGRPVGSVKKRPEQEEQNETFNSASLRKEIALANLKELEEAQKRGELLPAKLVLDWMDTSIVRAREIFTGIVGLVERIRQEADTITAQQMVEAELERGFEEMEGFCKKVTKMMFKKQEKAEAA